LLDGGCSLLPILFDCFKVYKRTHPDDPSKNPGSAKKETMILCGHFQILLLYDVAEAIDLAKLRELLGTRGGQLKHEFPRRTPDYVRFENPPVIETGRPLTLSTGEQLTYSIKYYAFAVVVVQFDLPFECDWNVLLTQTARWMDVSELEPHAREILREHLAQVAPAIVRPNDQWLQEDYLVINLQEIRDQENGIPTAAELLSSHAAQIAQLIRGELSPLAPRAAEEVEKSSLSYYQSDMVVVGSSAAFVYDRSEDAIATSQVLEYAKMQFLEFRYYDGLMSRLLSEVYDTLEKKPNILLSRWSIPRDAQRFNTIRLDVMELTERVDNAIKFVSDAYYARIYRLAATRMGVPDYRKLVDDQLQAAGDLYDIMVNQFNESRSFVIEVIVTILALLDVLLLLTGR
jgi:hypothetical protein